MAIERKFSPLNLANVAESHHIMVPVEFIQAISAAADLQEVLDTVSQWILRLFDAERASITLSDNSEYLTLYSISGNKAIPLDFKVPISTSFVGRVFSEKVVIICDELNKSAELDCVMLAQAGLGSCMDAPLICGGVCLGTLNVGHKNTHYYTKIHALEFQCLANFIALNISLRLQVIELDKLASTDHLTGAANRRIFSQQVQQDIHQFHENGQLFFFALMDLDHFKELNDRFGHIVGDHVLKQIVNTSEALVNDEGSFYRIGGEEFAIITKVQNEMDAIHLFNTIKDSIENTVIQYDGIDIYVTASIGVTTINSNDHNPESLLRRADKALYEAKSIGRNCVIMY